MKVIAKKDIVDILDSNTIIFYKGKIYDTKIVDGNLEAIAEDGETEIVAISSKGEFIWWNTDEFEFV